MSKVYSGLEVLEVMKEHYVIKNQVEGKGNYSLAFKLIDGLVRRIDTTRPHTYNDPVATSMDINFFLKGTFSIWREPLVAGDTVKVNITGGTIYGEIDTFLEEYGIRCFRFKGNSTPYKVSSAVRIEKDELAALKRKATFEQAGRRVDEFHSGDIVEFKVAGHTYQAIVMQQGLGKDKLVQFRDCYGGSIPARDITPVKFVTYVDATAPDYVKVAPCTAPPMPGMGQSFEYGGTL